jgi:hypothetical protein
MFGMSEAPASPTEAVNVSDHPPVDPKTADRWREIEFIALRQEILALGEAERSAVRFYIPATAIVYAVPYYVAERMANAMADAFRQALMWTFCVLIAELLTLAMVQTLFWSVDGARRIGVYIRTSIEPQTFYALRWEAVFFQLTQANRQFLNDSAVIGAIAVAANIFAACAVGFTFLDDRYFWLPLLPAFVLTSMSMVVIRRIVRSRPSRREYADRYEEILVTKSYAVPGLNDE